MKRSAPLLTLVALWLVACQGPSHPTPPPSPSPSPERIDLLGKYRQLVGAWMDSTTSDRYSMFEVWQVQNDSTLVGHGYALAGKDTVFVEDLKVEIRGALPTYLARIDAQNQGNWVPFQALQHGPDSLIFENPGHDFPQCISYIRIGDDRWDVTVSGTESGITRADRSLLVRR